MHFARHLARIGQRGAQQAPRARLGNAILISSGKQAAEDGVRLAPIGTAQIVAPTAEGAIASSRVARAQLLARKACAGTQQVIGLQVKVRLGHGGVKVAAATAKTVQPIDITTTATAEGERRWTAAAAERWMTQVKGATVAACKG